MVSELNINKCMLLLVADSGDGLKSLTSVMAVPGLTFYCVRKHVNVTSNKVYDHIKYGEINGATSLVIVFTKMFHRSDEHKFLL